MQQDAEQEAREILALDASPDAPTLVAPPRFNLLTPRSRCPACGTAIAARHNIPLLSWLWLRGRCSACTNPISWRYPAVELATGLLFAGAAWRFGPQPVALAWCGVLAVLVAATLIDWDTTLLPDSLTLPLLWAGLVAATLGWTLPLSTAVWGAVVGYLSLWSVYWLFKLATGKQGMGHGDFKLLAALGAWFGWQQLLALVLIASLSGLLLAAALAWRQRLPANRQIAFGPCLALAGAWLMFFGAPAALRL